MSDHLAVVTELDQGTAAFRVSPWTKTLSLVEGPWSNLKRDAIRPDTYMTGQHSGLIRRHPDGCKCREG